MAEDGRDDAETAGQRADPVAARNGDMAGGGDAYASGGPKGKGEAKPSGTHADGSGPPIASDVAPLVHTAMDDDVRDTEERARKTAAP